jgi:hypothetical protein
MLSPLFGAVRQTAYIVPDIESAIEDWARQLHVGPFALCREIEPLAGSRYRGAPTGDLTLNIAFAYIGDLQLELIEQVNDTPSMYLEAVEGRGYGHHHYGFCVEAFDEAYERAVAGGFESVVDAGARGYARMSYIESKSIPGLICEVIEWNDFTRPYFDGIHSFLSTADDTKRVHELDLAALVSSSAAVGGSDSGQ